MCMKTLQKEKLVFKFSKGLPRDYSREPRESARESRGKTKKSSRLEIDDCAQGLGVGNNCGVVCRLCSAAAAWNACIL